MKVSVLNIKGKDTGREIELSKKVFEIDASEHAVYLDVKQYLANQRQGNAKTKERAEIKGSTRKIKKQKFPYLGERSKYSVSLSAAAEIRVAVSVRSSVATKNASDERLNFTEFSKF